MRIKEFLCALILIIVPLISVAQNDYVANSDLNIRTGPGKEYSVIFTIQKGDVVEILSKNGTWYEIKSQEQTGYVSSKYLSPITKSQQSKKGNSMFPILYILGAIAFIWLLPILAIMFSNKTTTSEKIAWLLAVLFISWFAWIFYMLLAPIKKKKQY